MRRIGATLLATAMVMFVVAGVAQSEPIENGSASAGGWYVTAPGIGGAALTPSVSVRYPCDPDPRCEESREVLGVVAGDPLAPIASASVLYAEAQAFQQAEATATLQTIMQAAAGFTLPTQWNTHGYARVEGFSALNGQILADSLEAETAFGTDGSSNKISASGVRVVNLRLAGALSGETLAPILPGKLNQVLLDTGTVRIVYWETNWDPSNGSTTDGNPIWVNALHITDSVTGADITLAQASTDATFPPIARDDTASTTPGNAVAVNVLSNDNDPDGDLDRSSVTVTGVPTNGAVTCDNAGVCTYTPNAGFEGTDTFTYRVCDSRGACDSATVTITVASSGGGTGGGGTGNTTNAPPVAGDDSAETTMGVAVTVDVDANDSDPDGDPLTITEAAGTTANGGVYSCSDTGCTYTPPADYVGTDTFTYEICDTSDACDTATVTITVAAPSGGGSVANQPPNAADDSATTTAGTSVTVGVMNNDSDPDGNLRASASLVTAPSNGAAVCDGTSCTYTPSAGFTGTDSFEYRICDTANACDTAIATITVTAAAGDSGGSTGGSTGGVTNSPPVAQDDSVTSEGGASVVIRVLPNDSDPDGNMERSSVSVTVPPLHGAVICSDGECIYTPEPGYSGPDSFEYRVCDTDNACDTAVVSITVAGAAQDPPAQDPPAQDPPAQDPPAQDPPAQDPPAQDPAAGQPPVAHDDDVTVSPGEPVTIDVTGNDTDPDGDLDPNTVTVTVPPQHGSVICTATGCTYTPEPGYSGPDSFEYRVCDASGNCTTAVVRITIPAPSPDIEDGGSGDTGGEAADADSPGEETLGEAARGGDRDNAPAGPESDRDASHPVTPADAPPNAPVGFDDPLLGSPNAPLPFTGGDSSFYVGAALNLVLLGMLLLLIERFTRSRRMPQPCPAWHNHQETHASRGCAYGEWS